MKKKLYLTKNRLFFLFALTLFTLAFQNCSKNFDSVTTHSGVTASGSSNGSSNSPVVVPEEVSIKMDAQTPDCTIAVYAGWKCLSTTLVSQEGLEYKIDLRWNRPSQVVAGTVIWVNGNHGNAPFRPAAPEARDIQDRLSNADQVRSVEIIFADPLVAGNDNSGGYWKFPRGYYSAGSAYFAALEFVVNNGVKKGNFLNHIGGSNGTMVAAYAMANFNAGKYLDRLILNAGPFLSDITTACNTSHYASFSKSPTQFNFIKQLINYWSSGNATQDACGLTTDRVSILKAAQVIFPKTAVHVLMGAREEPDGFGPWILQSNLEWFVRVVAPEKSRVVIPTMGHDFHWPSLYDLARKPAPVAFSLNLPTLTFSHSLNGTSVTDVPANQMLYGVVRGIPAEGAFSCMARLGDLACDNPNNWTAMPNSDWRYVNGEWRSQFRPADLGATAGMSFSGFWYDSKTGKRTAVITLRVTQ